MRFAAIAAALLLASPALAQQAPSVDPRLAAPLVAALHAQVDLAQAALKVMQEDQAKKDADLAAWFKGWFGDAK